MFAFYFPTKVFKKINKTRVEVIETPKLNKECFSFVAGWDILLDINGAATTLVLGAALQTPAQCQEQCKAACRAVAVPRSEAPTAVCSLAGHYSAA